MYRPQTESSPNRIEGYRVAVQEITPGVNKRRRRGLSWYDEVGLDRRALSYHEGIRYLFVNERWKRNIDLRPPLNALHHLRVTSWIRIADSHSRNLHALFRSNVHLRNSGVDEHDAAIVAFPINAEAHATHSPVPGVCVMCQAWLEVLEDETLCIMGCQAKVNALCGDDVSSSHSIRTHRQIIYSFEVQEWIDLGCSNWHPILWTISPKADSHICDVCCISFDS